MNNISEVLTVAYDSGGEDISCLVVARKENDKYIYMGKPVFKYCPSCGTHMRRGVMKNDI